MGILDRLGNVIKSYLNDGSEKNFASRRGSAPRGDPDLDEAFDELNDFLNRDKAGPEEGGRGTPESDPFGRAGGHKREPPPPETLRPDFAELGLRFGASANECKEAYKKLLKIHHPDRHAGHPGNFRKATEKSARINAAYDRISQWRNGN